jgi:hypothetical protein
VIDFTKLSRTIEDYYLRPRKAKPEPTGKLYGDEWRYFYSLFTDPPTEPYDPADHSDFELDKKFKHLNLKN